jgi:hypothetical protein
MRPSGRKAMRQGSLNVATYVTVNGRLGSGFKSPALIWARTVLAPRVRSSAVFTTVFMNVFLRELSDDQE